MICLDWSDLLNVVILIGSMLFTFLFVWFVIFLSSLTIGHIKMEIAISRMSPEEYLAYKLSQKEYDKYLKQTYEQIVERTIKQAINEKTD